MPTIQVSCRAVLTDLDGTLVDSAKCVDYAWETWAKSHALDVDWIKRSVHGMRTADSLKLFASHLDLATEMKTLEDLECGVTTDLVQIAGASSFIESLPASRWAAVTSGSRRLASFRLKHVGLPLPEVFVTADDVSVGKPDPGCYLQAAKELGVSAADCLILEDSPNGIKAAKTAGGRVVAIGFSQDGHDISAADFIVHDLTKVRLISCADDMLTISLDLQSSSQ